ncbi:MAG: hypothetical protein M1812_006473 [Candelaria pacifica]|nr:MAG: hypothetical protein M1812_006473 [Candelaria pacifica]
MSRPTAPARGTAKPVGQNGIELDMKAWQPWLKVPDGYEMNLVYGNAPQAKSNSREGILEQMKKLAYNDFPTYGFSLEDPTVLDRLTEIETAWVNDEEVSEFDKLFWEACYERNRDSLNFAARDKYLFQSADTEFSRMSAEVQAKKDQVAQRARDAAREHEISMEKVLVGGMTDIGLDVSLHNELEAALMADPSYDDPSKHAVTPIHPTSTFRMPAPRPKVTAHGFRRPGPSARVKISLSQYIANHTDGNGKRKGHELPETELASAEPAFKHSRMDRTTLKDKTNATSPFLKAENADSFVNHLLNRQANNPKNNGPRMSTDGRTRLDRPMSRATQRMTMRSSMNTQFQSKPLVNGMQDLSVVETMQGVDEEEEEEEEL